MKKLTIMALVATAAFGLAGCAKEHSTQNGGKAGLSVKLNGGSTNVRSIEAPGVDQTVATVGLPEDGFYGFIYVVSNAGVAEAHELVVSEAMSAEGQFLGDVDLSSTVYVVANVPMEQRDEFAALSTLVDIKAAESAITTQKDYTTVALANRDAIEEPVVDPDGDGEALVNVNLTPLISRLELVQVRGLNATNGDITSFDVTGVYVDKFFRSFRWDGQGSYLYNMGTNPDYSQIVDFGMGDEALKSSGAGTIAIPGGTNVWAYNVPSGGMPMLVLKVQNVLIDNDKNTTIELANGTTVNAFAQTFYLTVTGYTGMAETEFLRGNIYKVGAIEFDVDDLKYLYPNPEDVQLTVTIEVDPWRVKSIGAVI
jgi:hypothetical protein